MSPAFNEKKNIIECYERVKRVFEENLNDYEYEHIFADNCSTDGTLPLLKTIAQNDKRIKVISNSRNYGVFPSTFNAILGPSGDAIIQLPVDLQDPPEILPQFIKEWEKGFKVVAGNRKNREENFILKNIRKLYYLIISKISNFELPQNVGEFQLIDKDVVQALKLFDDYNPYIRGMIASCGFPLQRFTTNMLRKYGKSKFSLLSYFDTSLNAYFSFKHANEGVIFCRSGNFIIKYFLASFILFETLVSNKQLAQPGVHLY